MGNLNCYSQNLNPDLFQTWYLTYLQNNDFAPSYQVADIVPAITPTLTVSSDLNFNGQVACNGYSGILTNTSFNAFQTTQFSQTLLVCNDQEHNSFEASYFNFLQSGILFEIATEGQGLRMTMYNGIFGVAIFQNFLLKTSDFDAEKIALYPNPSDAVIFLDFNQLMVSKIRVINSIGQNVKTINSDFETINISDLSPGIYILNISTEMGIVNKKIVKE